MEYYYSLAYPPCSLSVKFSHNCHDLFSVDDFFFKGHACTQHVGKMPVDLLDAGFPQTFQFVKMNGVFEAQ